MADYNFSGIRAQIVTQVEADLTDVTVFSFPQPADVDVDRNETADTYEWVQFGMFRLSRSEGTYTKRDDTYDLDGQIGVRHANSNLVAPDAAWKVCEDRAETLLNGVVGGVDTDFTLSGLVLHSEVVDVDETGGGDQEVYSCGFDFVVRIQRFAS